MSEQRHRFVAEYLVCGNGTKAALAAGFSAKSAAQTGSKLLREPAVIEAIAAGRTKVLAKIEVKAENVLAELAKVAFDDEVSALKVRALELLGKHLQLFVEKIDLKVDAMTPEERAARAAALIATARSRLLGSGGGGVDGSDD